MNHSELAKLHGVSPNTLRDWRRNGVDIESSPAVAAHVLRMTRRPQSWRGVPEDDEGETLESLKKRRLRADAERLELQTEITRGRFYPAEECHQVMTAWVAALKTGLRELEGTLPEHLAGREHAEVYSVITDAFWNLQDRLSNFESELWQGVLAEIEAPGDDPEEEL